MVSIKELTWSSHARIDRQERMLAILMTVGFGRFVIIRKKNIVHGRNALQTPVVY